MPAKRRRKSVASTEAMPPAEALNEPVQSETPGSNGDGPTVPMVNLDAFLAEISARLVTAGNITLPQQQDPQQSQERIQIIIFDLESTHYAVEVSHVGEVVRSPEITPVPGLPAWVLGVTNLHGDVVSVVDLPLFLSIRGNAANPAAYMIVVNAGDQRIGLVVDNVDIIYTFPAEQVISAPFKVTAEVVPYLRGAVERQNEFVRFLDCERLLLGPQMQQFA
jgi:purine-binding chemotaxis protein CheW